MDEDSPSRPGVCGAMQLHEKTALVTGAGRGIGRAIALALAKRGANLAVCDVRADIAEQSAAEIRGLGRRALAVQADVADAAQVQAMLGRVVESFGGIDVLCNNAGVVSFGKLVDLSERDWDFVM